MARPATRRSVVRGAVALAAAGLLAKAFSAAYRVLVARWLGAEAVGLYELAAPVLAAAISICGLGLPVATTAHVAGALGRGEYGKAYTLRRTARYLLVASGAAGAVAVFAGARPLAQWLGNPAAAGPLRAIAPAIAVAVYLAGERAWLQATGRLTAAAMVVAVEQLGRVGAAVAVARGYAPLIRGASDADATPRAAAAATGLAWSPTVGALAGLGAAAALGLIVPPREMPAVAPAGAVVREAARTTQGAAQTLLQGGWPNWAAGMVGTLATAVDAALVARRLIAAGWSTYRATAALGELNGMALPLATAPTVILGAISTAFMPAASAAWARGDGPGLRRIGAVAYFWALALSLPLSLALWQLAQPLCLVLYRNAAAAVPLGVLAFLGVLWGLSYVATALANAAGAAVAIVPGAIAGAVVKTVLVFVLTGSLGLGVRGAAWAAVGGAALTAFCNLRAVSRRLRCAPPWRAGVRVGGPALLAQALTGWGVWGLVSQGPLLVRLLMVMLAELCAYTLTFAAGWWRWRALGGRMVPGG